MFKWKLKAPVAKNAIYLEDSNGKEGRPFKSRFLQAGLVKYDFGVCLLQKETIDKFINTFVGVPVIIDHKDFINPDDIVGKIQNIWFSTEDGWFWCDGIITNEKAIELIENGYNVSCQYAITEYIENLENKLHNGNPYDKEILNGVFEHLAIVKNPRYEGAFIAANAYLAKNNDFKEQDHPRDEEGKFTKGNSSSNNETYFKNWTDAPEIELKNNELSSYSDLQELRKAAKDYYKTNLQGQKINRKELGDVSFSGKGWKEFVHTSADADKLKAIPQLPEIITKGKLGDFQKDYKDRKDGIQGFYPIYCNLKTNNVTKKAEALIAKDNDGNLFYTMFLDYDRPIAKNKRDITSNQDRLPLNFIISNSIDDFNPIDFINELDKGGQMDEKLKELCAGFAKALLKAKNEAGKEKEEDSKKGEETAKNEDVDKRKGMEEVGRFLRDKGLSNEDIQFVLKTMFKDDYNKSSRGTVDNSSDDEETKNKKASNEKVDKRERIRQIMALVGELGGSDEQVRTAGQWAEDISYNKSEAGTADNKAKNKCKNEDEEKEDEYEELKEKVYEEVKNKKASNSLDELKSVFFQGEGDMQSSYQTREDRLEAGMKY